MTSFPIYFVFLTVLMFGPMEREVVIEVHKTILNSCLRLIKSHCINALYARSKHQKDCWKIEIPTTIWGIFYPPSNVEG